MTAMKTDAAGDAAAGLANLATGRSLAIELSIIIIGRNEESRIERCLRSVFAALDGLQNYEVIYVDSASQDRTVSVAQRFPIGILQLRPDWSLSPSAGRYVGFLHAAGRFLMFVDGDTVLYKKWIREARDFLSAETTCGGVAGIVHELVQAPDGSCLAVNKNVFEQQGPADAHGAVSLGGIAMYRREAMRLAGTFNPYLKTGEEGEVALRIRQAGYSLMRLNRPMCLTYAPPRESFREIFRRTRSGLFDFGPSLRYSISNKLALKYIREELWEVCTFTAAMALAIAALAASFAAGDARILAFAVVAAAAYVLARKTPTLALVGILKRALITYRTCVSFMTSQALPVATYPTDVVIVRADPGSVARPAIRQHEVPATRHAVDAGVSRCAVEESV